VAGVQLRPGDDRGGLVNAPAAEPRNPAARRNALLAGYSAGRSAQQVTLIDLLDRLLQGGVVIQGQVVLAAADIDLVEVDLSLVVAAVQKLQDR
jgi:hypothetical protein